MAHQYNRTFRFEIYRRNITTLHDHLYARTDDPERADRMQRECLEKVYKTNKYDDYVVFIKDNAENDKEITETAD